MLIILLMCSFVSLFNAIPSPLQPMLNGNTVLKFNETSGSLMQQVLAHKNDSHPDKFFIDLFNGLDPQSIADVISLVEALLATSQNELNQLTSASSNAGQEYDAAVAAHNAAIVAQTEGVAASQKILKDGTSKAKKLYDQTMGELQSAHDQKVRVLQAGVDASLSAKATASDAKTVADDMLAADETRLNNEIDSLTQIIAILHPLKALNQIPRDGIYSWFKATNIDRSNSVWSSSIGDFKGKLVHGSVPTGVVSEAGNGAKSPITYLKGTRDSVYDFGAIVPEPFTICSMSRYTTTTNQGRVLQGSPSNWLHGHHYGRTGVCHYGGGWNTPTNYPGSTDWLIMCGSSDRTQSVYANGVARPLVNSPRLGNQNIWVNGGGWGGERSDWGVAEIITWDRVLTVTEIEQVSAAMRNELGG